MLPADLASYSPADRRQASLDARPMLLAAHAVSNSAHGLVSDLIERYAPAQRPTSAPKLRIAAEAMLADLLAAQRHTQWARRALSAQSFVGKPVTRRMFDTLRKALVAAQLVEVIPGYYQHDTIGGPKGFETLFRPSQPLLDLAAAHGVSLESLPEHFTSERMVAPASKDLLVLKGQKPQRVGRTKEQGATLSIAPGDEEATRLLVELDELNAYLAAAPIEGFAFSGLRRIFNNGDDPAFRWQWGGRYYPVPGGDNYVKWKGGKEARAASIRLHGERVGEVDLSASHLTVLYGLLGEPFDAAEDPYGPAGASRDRVKRWVTYALGKGSVGAHEGNWYAKAREWALRRHPILERYEGSGLTTLDLQFHEAEIIKDAMRRLRDLEGVAVLPVFDSLVAPLSKLEAAERHLRDAVSCYFPSVPINPKLHVHGMG